MDSQQRLATALTSPTSSPVQRRGVFLWTAIPATNLPPLGRRTPPAARGAGRPPPPPLAARVLLLAPAPPATALPPLGSGALVAARIDACRYASRSAPVTRP